MPQYTVLVGALYKNTSYTLKKIFQSTFELDQNSDYKYLCKYKDCTLSYVSTFIVNVGRGPLLWQHGLIANVKLHFLCYLPKKKHSSNSVENRACPPARYRARNYVDGQIRHPTRPAERVTFHKLRGF